MPPVSVSARNGDANVRTQRSEYRVGNLLVVFQETLPSDL